MNEQERIALLVRLDILEAQAQTKAFGMEHLSVGSTIGLLARDEELAIYAIARKAINELANA